MSTDPPQARVAPFEPLPFRVVSKEDAIRGLVALLPDDDSWEEMCDIGAPPFVYVVGERAADALERWGQEAAFVLPELLKLVASGSSRSVRVRAARVASRLDDAGVEAAARALAYPDVRVGMLGVLTGRLSGKRLDHAPHLLAVLRLLLADDRNVVWAAQELLQKSDERASIAAPAPAALVAAVAAFIAEVPDAVQRIEARAADPEWRFAVAKVLGRFVGVGAAADALARIVLASRDTASAAAAEGLLSVGPLLPQPTVDALVRVFSETISMTLARVLAAYGARAAAAAPGLVQSIGRPPENDAWATRQGARERRGAAAGALAAIAPGGVAHRSELLTLVFESDEQGSALAAFVLGVASLAPEVWVPLACDRLRAADASTRRSAARGLTHFGPRGALALDALREAMRARCDSLLASTLASAIEAMGAAALPALPELLEWLDSPNEKAALSAIAAIGPPACAEAEPALARLRAERIDRGAKTAPIDTALAKLRGA